MKHREFITIFGGMAGMWTLDARAQQSAISVIGFLSSGSPNAYAGRFDKLKPWINSERRVLRRQRDQPIALTCKERIGTEEERIGAWRCWRVSELPTYGDVRFGKPLTMCSSRRE